MRLRTNRAGHTRPIVPAARTTAAAATAAIGPNVKSEVSRITAASQRGAVKAPE